jgi:hypothetical protein
MLRGELAALGLGNIQNILADAPWHWRRVRQLKSVASNLFESVNDFTKHSMVIDGMSVKPLSEKPKCLAVLLFQRNIPLV